MDRVLSTVQNRTSWSQLAGVRIPAIRLAPELRAVLLINLVGLFLPEGPPSSGDAAVLAERSGSRVEFWWIEESLMDNCVHTL